jgi:hypothetical protein
VAVAQQQREANIHPGDNLLLSRQDAAQAGAFFLEVREGKAGGLGRRIRVRRMPAANKDGRGGLARRHRRCHRVGHRRDQEEEEDHMTANVRRNGWGASLGQRDCHQ